MEFAVGAQVLLRIHNLRLKLPKKLQDHYIGPFRVTSRMGPTAHHLDLSTSSALKHLHLPFMLAFWGNSGIMVCTSSLLQWKLMAMMNGKSRGFWVIDCLEDSNSILYRSKGLMHQKIVRWHLSSLPMQLTCYLSIVLLMVSEFISYISCELSYLAWYMRFEVR